MPYTSKYAQDAMSKHGGSDDKKKKKKNKSEEPKQPQRVLSAKMVTRDKSGKKLSEKVTEGGKVVSYKKY